MANFGDNFKKKMYTGGMGGIMGTVFTWRNLFIFGLILFFMAPLSAGENQKKLKAESMKRTPVLRLAEDGYRLIWNDGGDGEPKVFLTDDRGNRRELYVERGSVKGKVSGYYADIRGLSPDTGYSVTIPGFGKIDFVSPKKKDPSFRFAAISDHQTYVDLTQKGFEAVAKEKPDCIISCGDMLEDGNLRNWKKNFFEKVGIFSGIPFAAAQGNNDVGAHYFESFLSLDSLYYTAVYGDVRFIFLDSNKSLDAESVQYEWLKKILQKNDSRWTVVVYHHGSFLSVRPNPSNKKGRKSLLELFEKNGVDLVLNGHNHIYDRTSPIQGITFVTIPSMSGKKSLYRINQNSGYYGRTVQGVNGYGIVDVTPGKLSFVVKSVDGEILDSFEIVK